MKSVLAVVSLCAMLVCGCGKENEREKEIANPQKDSGEQRERHVEKRDGESVGLQAGLRAGKSTPLSDVLFERKIKSIAGGLDSKVTVERVSAAKRALELKEMYPDRDYSELIIPLMRIVKDEKAERAARIPAVHALHLIRSERGDFAIEGMSSYSNDREFRRLCSRLSSKRDDENNLARLERERPEVNLTKR